MSTPASLEKLVGEWVGTNRLWLSTEKAPHESNSTASVSRAAKGRFLAIQYSWAFEGEPQEGLLLVGCEKMQNVVKAAWIDSWHMSDKFMTCEGATDERGGVFFRGSYAAPPRPEWGWRTVIEPGDGKSFRMLVYNVSPEGKEALAVEAIYRRRA
jgi:hypothetical protein